MTEPGPGTETADSSNAAGGTAAADGTARRRPAQAQAQPDQPAPRAGRNLPQAIGVGVGLAVLVIASLALLKETFLVIVAVAIGIGAWEMRRALTTTRIQVPLVPLLIGSVSMLVGAYARGAEALVVTFGLTCIGLLLWRVADGLDGAARDLGGSFLLAFYPCFLAGFAALLLAPEDGNLRVVLFLLVTVFSDIGGYAVGVLFGRHPMAPSISPKKSWEGFAGSVLTCAVVGAAAMVLLLSGSWWAGAVVGALAAATATLGDLVESMVKRDLGIKDMGTLLPGHGGMMDRLDSLVLTAPLVWGLLLLFVPLP